VDRTLARLAPRLLVSNQTPYRSVILPTLALPGEGVTSFPDGAAGVPVMRRPDRNLRATRVRACKVVGIVGSGLAGVEGDGRCEG
jgi:hypothetical protein